MTPSTFMSLESLTSPVLAFGMPSGWEWIALLAIGLLVFGRRLPEVGRSVGKSIVEFKKGIKGIEDDIDQEASNSRGSASRELTQDTTDSARSAMYDRANEEPAKDH